MASAIDFGGERADLAGVGAPLAPGGEREDRRRRRLACAPARSPARSRRAPSALRAWPRSSSGARWWRRRRAWCSAGPRRSRAAGPQELSRVGERLAVRGAHAGHDLAVRGIDDVAGRVDDDERGDDQAVGQRDGARCRRRPSCCVPSPPALPTVAPAPAPMLPSATGASSPLAPPDSRSRRPAGSGRRRPTDRRAPRPARSARARGRTRSRSGFSSRYRMTPDAESRPNALPPERTIACAIWTRLTGLSRSVSRVAGAEPRTSTPAVAPASARITVQPVGRSASV